jgi:prepilin-type N-terminal cleavage/methylation domain-containing protein
MPRWRANQQHGGARSPSPLAGGTTGGLQAAGIDGPTLPQPRPGREGGLRRGFTLIELMIVIVVIGILIAALSLVGGRVVRAQKVKYTEMIMRNVTTAIDQFAAENPLRENYDGKNHKSFGPYPPYQLANWGIYGGTNENRVGAILERSHEAGGTQIVPTQLLNNYTLATRLWGDLGNFGAGDWVGINTNDPANDDIRALYTYLRVYSPGVVSQIPEDAIKPLTDNPEFVDTAGNGDQALSNSKIDVFGIHDAWGVPLDYFLMVNVKWGVLPGTNLAGWIVTDRIPVLRSRGMELETYESLSAAELSAQNDTWLFSEPFQTPAANVDNAGVIVGGSGPQIAGWVRARAGSAQTGYAEDYPYVPVQNP